MRHIGSFLIALVFGPSVFLLTGTGLSAFSSALDDNKAVDPLGAIAALGALLLAGVLYGILVMARLSPVGPGLAGLTGFFLSGWALFDIRSYEAAFNNLDVHMGGAVGQLGLGILLSVPLVATIVSPRRWRKDDTPVEQTYQPPTYRPPVYQAPQRPDPTWQLPAQPAYQPLPDVVRPSLGYPAAAAQSEPPTVPIIVAAEQAEPLPKRVPNAPPPAMTPSDEPAALVPAGGEEPTVKLEQQVKQQGKGEE